MMASRCVSIDLTSRPSPSRERSPFLEKHNTGSQETFAKSHMMHNMRFPPWLLPTTLALLMVDAIIELSFVSSMVAWLHRTAGGSIQIVAPSTSPQLSFQLHGKPANLLVNQGHTSNGAAGTAFVLVGLGGILVLTLTHNQRRQNQNKPNTAITFLHTAWLISTLLSAVLTLSALIYTFVITTSHAHQTIDLPTAAALDNRPYPNYVAYPLDAWTPENWFAAVLGQLQLVQPDQRDDIAAHLRVMRAWRWNLVPLFVVGVGLCVVAVGDAWGRKREEKAVLLPRGGGAKMVGRV